MNPSTHGASRSLDRSWPAPALRMWTVFIILFIASLTGCDGADDPTGPVGPTPAPVAQVAVNPFEVTAQVGQVVELDVQLSAADGSILTGRRVTFTATSEPQGVVSVDSTGVVRTLKAGFAVVRATSEGKHGDAAIVVIADQPGEPQEPGGSPAPVIQTLEPASLPAGSPAMEITLRGTGFDETTHAFWNGSGRTSTLVSETEFKVQLRVEDLRLSGAGQLQVIRHGAGEAKESNVKVLVIDRAVALVEFQEGDRILFPGESRPFRVRLIDDRGVEMEGVTPEWSTANAGILQVDAEGWVTALAPGQTVVTARAGNRESSRMVRVSTPPATGLMVTTWSPLGPDRAAVDFGIGNVGGGSTRPLGPDGAEAVVSPNGDRILFVARTDDGGADLFVMNWDGSGRRRLTTNPGVDDQPVWSPDGQRAAFRSFRNGYPDVWSVAIDGSDLRQVTDFGPVRFGMYGAHRPTWSPDGQWIAFALGDAVGIPARTRLARIRPDGSDLRFITEAGGFEDNEPSFSPDGSRLVFRRTVAGQDHLVITDLAGNESIFAHDLGSGRRPRWSPDGRWIVAIRAGAPHYAYGGIVLKEIGLDMERVYTAAFDATWIPTSGGR